MRILISGSRGFIGNFLCSQLLQAGHEIVKAVHSNPSEGDMLISYDDRCLYRNTGQGVWNEKGLGIEKGFDVVINLAGEPITASRWDAHKKANLYNSRIDTTKLLGNAFTQSGLLPKVFLSGSAVGYYGSRQDEILTEKSAKGSGFLSDLCAKWEETALSYQSSTTRVVLLRTGIVLGKEGGLLKSVLPMFKNGVAGKLGSGQQWISWISLVDVARAVMFLIDRDDIEGPVNVAGPEPVRNVDLTHTLAELVKKPAHLHMPQLALELAVGKVTAAEFVLASQRALPNVLLEAGFDFSYQNAKEALVNAIETS